MEIAGAIGFVFFIVIIAFLILGIKYVIKKIMYKTFDSVADTFRDKEHPKYKESEKTNLSERYNRK